jgi:hypothetical protein
MFTCRLKQLVGDAHVTTRTPSRDIGSQPMHTKVSPGKAAGKKHAWKAVSKVVALPFRSLPSDFGMQLLPAKEVSHKKGD